jgi:hypothetical protein
MTTLSEIEAAADSLPTEQQEQLLAFLQMRLGRKRAPADESNTIATRRAGLHAGVWEVAPDFDAALPVDFWLGQDT